jgi:hypothetical protein
MIKKEVSEREVKKLFSSLSILVMYREQNLKRAASPAHLLAPDLCKKAVSVIAVAEFCTLLHHCRCCCCHTESCCIGQGAALCQRQYQSSHHTIASADRAPDRHGGRRKVHRELSSGE